jgi:hypothetical protein
VIPSVFTVMDDLEHLIKRGVAKLRGHKADAPTEHQPL